MVRSRRRLARSCFAFTSGSMEENDDRRLVESPIDDQRREALVFGVPGRRRSRVVCEPGTSPRRHHQRLGCRDRHLRRGRDRRRPRLAHWTTRLRLGAACRDRQHDRLRVFAHAAARPARARARRTAAHHRARSLERKMTMQAWWTEQASLWFVLLAVSGPLVPPLVWLANRG